MGSINTKRVVLGGLLAGVIVLVSQRIFFQIFRDAIRQQLENHNFMLGGTNNIIILAVLTLVAGIVVIWFYAVARPRFGPGPRTALIVFLPIWFLVTLADVVLIIAGLNPVTPTVINMAWYLVTGAIATVAGAWVHQEE